jgi:hypothetical protein
VGKVVYLKIGSEQTEINGLFIQAPSNNLFQIIRLSLGLLVISSSGCQSFGIEAWKREILAQPAMQFQVRDQELTTDDHFYFSKEGTSGGRGFAGGGCGCN